MSKYRQSLPQLNNRLFLTDAGLETELVFKHGIELPEFAAFDLLKNEAGRRRLHDYFTRFVELATRWELGAVLETPTWRASRDWGERLGYNGCLCRRCGSSKRSKGRACGEEPPAPAAWW